MTTKFQINLKKDGNTPLKMENYAKALLTQKGILRINVSGSNTLTKASLETLIKKVNPQKSQESEKAG